MNSNERGRRVHPRGVVCTTTSPSGDGRRWRRATHRRGGRHTRPRRPAVNAAVGHCAWARGPRGGGVAAARLLVSADTRPRRPPVAVVAWRGLREAVARPSPRARCRSARSCRRGGWAAATARGVAPRRSASAAGHGPPPAGVDTRCCQWRCQWVLRRGHPGQASQLRGVAPCACGRPPRRTRGRRQVTRLPPARGSRALSPRALGGQRGARGTPFSCWQSANPLAASVRMASRHVSLESEKTQQGTKRSVSRLRQ